MQGSGPPTPSKSVPLGMGKWYLENPTGGDPKILGTQGVSPSV